MSKQWNKEEIKFLKDNYKDMSYKEIAIKLNRTENAIKAKTNKLGLIKSKYIYNKDYFKVIDSEEKAYWLGFIYADGYVCANDTGSELGIELQIGDIEHLKKFNKSLCGNIPVTKKVSLCNLNGKYYDSCLIRIYCTKMVRDLGALGVSNNKSYDIKMPEIDPKYLHHFIRGFFDGDGCICESKKKKGRSSIKCDFTCGCEYFVNQLREVLYKNDICTYISKEKDKPYRLMIGGMINCDKFLSYIYKDATIYLDRKLNKKEELYARLDIKERIIASLLRNK